MSERQIDITEALRRLDAVVSVARTTAQTSQPELPTQAMTLVPDSRPYLESLKNPNVLQALRAAKTEAGIRYMGQRT